MGRKIAAAAHDAGAGTEIIARAFVCTAAARLPGDWLTPVRLRVR
jgi:hypothetical protein